MDLGEELNEKTIKSLSKRMLDIHSLLSENMSFLFQAKKQRVELEIHRDSLGFFEREERKRYNEKILPEIVSKIEEYKAKINELEIKYDSLSQQIKEAKLKLPKQEQKEQPHKVENTIDYPEQSMYERKSKRLYDDIKKETLRKEHFEHGGAYFQEGNYDSAIKEFTAILGLDPQAHNIYGIRGFIYLKKGDFDLAIKDFDEAIRFHPEALEYLNRGDAYFRKGEFAKAIEDLEKAIRLDSNNTEARRLLEKAKEMLKSKLGEKKMENTFNGIKVALFEGRIDKAEELLKNDSGFNINAGDEDNFRLIHFAALDGNKPAIKWLLDKRASIDAREKSGLTSMHLLASGGKIDTMKYLKECGANIEATDDEGRTPMFHAFMAKNIESVKCLNELGAKVDVYDSSGMKPVFCAVSSGCVEFFERLRTVYSPDIFVDLLKSRAQNGMPLTYMAEQLNLTEFEEWLHNNGVQLK